MSGRALEFQVLRLGCQNQAPTEQDQRRHVYCVYLLPFGPKPFDVGESIGGGHGERGGSFRFDLQELLAWPQWPRHFELPGAGWAVPMVEAGRHDEDALLHTFVREICRRAGGPDMFTWSNGMLARRLTGGWFTGWSVHSQATGGALWEEVVVGYIPKPTPAVH